MDNDDLRRRLNVREYINGLKAGQCLIILKEVLDPFLQIRMSAFHKDLISRNELLRKPCVSSCRLSRNQFPRLCVACSEWRDVILSHHTQPDNTVNWDNCVPSAWRTDHWEVAKAFMPRGKAKVKAAGQFDTPALLNLINYCDWFQDMDLQYVREMIRHRNDLMHTPNFTASDEWMKRFRRTLDALLRQLPHDPQRATVVQQINEVLDSQWSIHVGRSDQMDSTTDDTVEADFDGGHLVTIDLISRWERELLQERLVELLEDADDANIPDDDELKSLGDFLQDNRDLAEHFSTALQTINSLRKR